ncbi:hypothetical protein ACE6H2_010537 [Prunus campanulata]
MIDEFEKIKQTIGSVWDSTILGHNLYPTGVKDHDYKTWGYKRNRIHAFFFFWGSK